MTFLPISYWRWLVVTDNACIRLCRLPEELNGHGCYGTAALAVLVGAGYTLYWAKDATKAISNPPQYSISIDIRNNTQSGDANEYEKRGRRWKHCGCVGIRRPRGSSRGRESQAARTPVQPAKNKRQDTTRTEEPIEKFLRVFMR